MYSLSRTNVSFLPGEIYLPTTSNRTYEGPTAPAPESDGPNPTTNPVTCQGKSLGQRPRRRAFPLLLGSFPNMRTPTLSLDLCERASRVLCQCPLPPVPQLPHSGTRRNSFTPFPFTSIYSYLLTVISLIHPFLQVSFHLLFGSVSRTNPRC
jgi:hypothetical protein